MLEGLVAWVLNNYLGKYVENLNTDQLSVALLSGKVELENLPLKKDALRHLGLPVEIKAGFIGKVQLQVPVRQIRSAPWLIAIEKLYLVAAPVNLDEWDSSVEAHIAHERKTALLDALEAQWRAEHEASDAGYYAASYSSWLSYGTGLLANIVENLQLKLNDVHIRYEDAITCAPQSFACGLTVQSLTAESCDADWVRGFTLLADADGCSFKLLELQQLAVYWDPMPPAAMMADCTLAELTERMRATWLCEHRYLVAPASASARVRRERCEQPLRSRTRPRLACHLTLPSVRLDLTSRQYSEVVGCVLGLERIARLREFRSLRPDVPVRGHVRVWWLYALRCHAPHHRWMDPKPTWATCVARARSTRQYVDICLEILSNPAATLPPDRQATKDQFEWDTPLWLLKPLREVAMRKVPIAIPASAPEDAQASSGRSVLVRWFPLWWGWYAPASAESDQSSSAQPPQPPQPAQAAAPTAPRLEEEILDVIADSLEDNTLLRRDTVFGLFEFTLERGSLNLCTETEDQNEVESATRTEKVEKGEENGTGVELQFSSVCVRVETRPRTASHALHMSLGAVCLRERITPGTLFPVLVAPQGMIREGLSAMNAAASAAAWWRSQHAPASPSAPPPADPLFQLSYEKRPFGLNCDYKLWVKSMSLEVVYCAAAARWAQQFVAAPWGPRRTIAHVRDQTRARLITHWEHMLRARPGERRSWHVELDVSAPQILFVEQLSTRGAAVLLVDFGRLRLANAHFTEDCKPSRAVPAATAATAATATTATATTTTTTTATIADDDEEMFMTPCSTPPGSLLSPASPPDPPPPAHLLDAANLHISLYDRYNIELSDLQILVGRAKDNWKYAHTKTTSALHLLDRFSISLQAERRVVHTSDPQYPAATLCGSLPALVVHLSEHKLAAVRAVAAGCRLTDVARESPRPDRAEDEAEDSSVSSDTERSDLSAHNNATLFMLQFAIDQMSLEVQSRGRSIAEVQVCGVRAALSARPCDLSLSLSVHSLLLVDALQTYGPDFELLVASHKHVGMDTASGSIRGSEPTSPTSPSSPDARAAPAPPTPRALRQALRSLRRASPAPVSAHASVPESEEVTRRSPTPNWMSGVSWASASTEYMSTAFTWPIGTDSDVDKAPGDKGAGVEGTVWGGGNGWSAPGLVDTEALIAVEICLVRGERDSEDLRIANILFNNLDVIANQETIVELIGFAHRVLGPRGPHEQRAAPCVPPAPGTRTHGAPDDPAASHARDDHDVLDGPDATDAPQRAVRTEITFDFHRLGVLLLRAAVLDGALVAKKIATATVSEARIQATVAARRVEVGGSLGGVQVVSLCEGAGVHTRVLAAGRAHSPREPLEPHAPDEKALLFTITRNLLPGDTPDATVVEASVSLQVASVWYTQSGALLHELQSCLTEFKQYLANLARSIRAAAADMAIGLVHPSPRGESLYGNPRLAQSAEAWGRRRTTSAGATPAEPSLEEPDARNDIVLTVNIELESPVVVLPRSAQSTQVFVAHLGRMSLTNQPGAPRNTQYNVRVRDISLASLDVGEKLKRQQLTAESMGAVYDVSRGRPVLHDTALQLALDLHDIDNVPHCEVSGAIVGALQVSASREQYEQLLDTLRWVADTASPQPPSASPCATGDGHAGAGHPPITADVETSAMAEHAASALVEPAVPTLRLDPQLRAAVLAVPPPQRAHEPHAPRRQPHAPLTVSFQVSEFAVELRADLGGGERSLVALTFREFALTYQHLRPHETSLQVSLHSVTMEDLTKEPDSKHRMLLVSHAPPAPRSSSFLSKSCPDLRSHSPDDLRKLTSLQYMQPLTGSLPAAINTSSVAQTEQPGRAKLGQSGSKCGATPPCSPEPLDSESFDTHEAFDQSDTCDIMLDMAGKGDAQDSSEPAARPATSVDDNLVWVSVHTRDPQHPHFHDKFDQVSKQTKVEFNCLKLVLSIDSWVAVLDFFGVAGDEPSPECAAEPASPAGVGVAYSGESAALTETEVLVRSLSVVVVGARGDACRALVSCAHVRTRSGRGARRVRATLDALALVDLAPRAAPYAHRLRTRGRHALVLDYKRLNKAEAEAAGHETSLSVDMGPLMYVHTKRFVLELQAFARDFSLLRRVIAQARRKVSSAVASTRTDRMRVRLRCAAPLIVLPVSGRSRTALAAQLRLLHLDNCFRRAGDPDTVSTLADPTAREREVLDVRDVRLEGVTLRCWGAGRPGAPLLPAPATFSLRIEHNLSDTHNVPDTSVQGTLTTLELALDAAQYRLVRGVLAHNLGEPCLDLLPPATPPAPATPATPGTQQQVWTTWSLKLDLHDVRVRLAAAAGPLACVNFIKSRLLVETYSDFGQDIDLVSQEILVSDVRYAAAPANRRGNVFGHIVQPLPDHRHSVQAEVHARKRQDSSAYTILINNMRLMAILDWWEAANQFIMQPPLPPTDPDLAHLEAACRITSEGRAGAASNPPAAEPAELKLNVTDSQLVLVEDASIWDTNAVILKSTTVVRYAGAAARPLSCELSGLEVFSCVLGLEDETALAILEPANLHAYLDAARQLHMSMGTLNLRLSYHDMRMFAAMLRSLPAQARAALSGKLEGDAGAEHDAPANSVHMRAGVASEGDGGATTRLLSARWAQAARVSSPVTLETPPAQPSAVWPLAAVKVIAECVTLCVIDDCLDSDVPLLEVSLSELRLDQDLRKVEETFPDPVLVSTPAATGAASGGAAPPAVTAGAGAGQLRAQLAVDYYNRTLSAWEPALEPWRFETKWEYTLSSALSLRRLQVEVNSAETLDVNVTAAMLELSRLVRGNWSADYYALSAAHAAAPPPANSAQRSESGMGGGSAEASPKGSPAGHRRRAPFVPYALRNHTGHRLWFTTLLTTAEQLSESETETGGASAPDDSWVSVAAGETEPFSFGLRRGRARCALHRLALRLSAWGPPDPVRVDQVGVFFRTIMHQSTGSAARLVLEVTLEGSARKLVTVRSALQLVNRLPHAVEVRADIGHAPALSPECTVALGAFAGGGAATRRLREACASLHWRGVAGVLPACRALAAGAPPATRSLARPCGAWRGPRPSEGMSTRAVQVAAGTQWSAPLSAHAAALSVRPLPPRASHAPVLPPARLDWRDARGERELWHRECRSPPNHIYRFCCVVVRERFPEERGEPIAGHTLTLVPALRLENLLPLELQYRAADVSGTLAPADAKPFHEVNVEEGVEVSVKLEGFGWSSALCVGGAAAGGGSTGGGASFSARLKLRDLRGRRLYLNARVSVKKTDGIKVSISAAYWLVNRTGLPLVFRAEGGASEAAGQFTEHELARMVAPLLFAFADSDGGPTIAARLGTGIAPNPEWCSPFGLGPGVSVKRLEARGGSAGGEAAGAGAGSTGERSFAVGVAVRAGRGRYRRTNIVTLTPRYQLHNNTSRHLQFAQKCTATTLSDPGAAATHVSAVAGCHLPWHWARRERDQLLCARVLHDASTQPRTAWSGGFRIDKPRSLHVACRESGGSYVLLRVEVVSQGGTLLVVLTDAECAPPPLRIDNHSPVAIMFHQVGCVEECVVGAGARACWALPEPEGTSALALRAPGGPRLVLPLDAAAHTHRLLYQNFLYVAFPASSARENSMSSAGKQISSDDDSVLVLEVPAGSTRVLLGRKRYGDRSQLWRRAAGGQLVHEGSSPPQPTDAALPDDNALSPHAMVLDIEEAAPRPGVAAALVLRRADPRRRSTQTWRLVPPGRMACAHANLCVQPLTHAAHADLVPLVPGARVVLGLPGGRAVGRVPGSQAVSWHTLRPGCGRLDVSVCAAGPTRLVRIYDHEDPDSGRIEGDEEECGAAARGRGEWGVRVSLGGLGVSLVGRAPPAELVYALFAGLRLELARTPRAALAALSVDTLQWDNQLVGAASPLMYAGGGGATGAALHAAAELLPAPATRYNAHYFRHLVVALRPVAVRLEERLILVLWSWAEQWQGGAEAAEQPDEVEYETRRVLHELTALHATRYYFALIKLIPSQIRLSMYTASKLEAELAALKQRLGLTLVRFEHAAVELEPFVRAHVFDTAACLARHSLQHFKDELKWQAAKILGSVDFLGNPLGFMADVSEGVSGLLLEGNVGALVKNVTHGISNSAAKVTESLGDGLERVVGDEAHEETRRRIRSAAAGAHLAAGLRGLGLGLLGGMTSLVKHSYEGATQEGLGGFVSGVGKGLVGTVTKPVIGVLDLAAAAAAAVRESSARAGRAAPARTREPRPAPHAAALMRYCPTAARGAQLLHALAPAAAPALVHPERFLAYRPVRGAPHDIRALLTDTHLRIFTCKHDVPQVVMETHLSNLVSCTAVYADGAHLVELGVRGAGPGDALRRPRVQCDSGELAAWLARSAAHARQLHRDLVHTLQPHPDL